MKCNQTKFEKKNYIKFENYLVFEKKSYNYEEVDRILFVTISIMKKRMYSDDNQKKLKWRKRKIQNHGF